MVASSVYEPFHLSIRNVAKSNNFSPFRIRTKEKSSLFADETFFLSPPCWRIFRENWKNDFLIQKESFRALISNDCEHFTTKRNHWTLCLNCLIKFSVAAKLKICFFEKNLMFLFYSEFYVREPMVFYSPFSGIFSLLDSLFPIRLSRRSDAFPLHGVFEALPVTVLCFVNGSGEEKGFSFRFGYESFSPIYVGTTSSNRIIDFPRLLSFPARARMETAAVLAGPLWNANARESLTVIF